MFEAKVVLSSLYTRFWGAECGCDVHKQNLVTEYLREYVNLQLAIVAQRSNVKSRITQICRKFDVPTRLLNDNCCFRGKQKMVEKMEFCRFV